MTDTPFACSLTAEQSPARRDALAALDVIDARVRGRVAVRRDEHSEAALAEFVRAERECCPFFELDVTAEPDRLVLDVTGPQGAEELVAALVREFREAAADDGRTAAG